MEKFNNNRIEYLTSTFLETGLNAKEQSELKELLQQPEMRAYFKQSYLLWNITSSKEKAEDIEQLYKRVLYQIEEKENVPIQSKNRVYTFSLIVAAASVLAFVFGMGFYHFAFDSTKNTIADRNIEQATSQLKVAIQRIIAPLGSKSQIELPDGTVVTLNAGSTLEYTTAYGSSGLREVWLEGEAYFKVAKDKHAPFLVNAQHSVIRALGTEFNVKAYTEEQLVQTTLVEGSVSINPNVNTEKKTEEILLKPNQMVTVYNQETVTKTTPDTTVNRLANSTSLEVKDPKISLKDVNPILYTSWKDPRWIIEGEAFEELLLKLQRRYDVVFNIKDESLKEYKFSGIIENETLEQVLDILKVIAPIDYTINKKQVSLSINQKQKNAFEKSMN